MSKYGTPLAQQPVRQCAQCGKHGPEEMFEVFNTAGNLACKAKMACQLRQGGHDPATVLCELARDMSTRGELHTLTSRELAELAYDLRGEDWRAGRDRRMGLTESVTIHLSGRGDSALALRTVAGERARRRRRLSALKGADTRRQRRAALVAEASKTSL